MRGSGGQGEGWAWPLCRPLPLLPASLQSKPLRAHVTLSVEEKEMPSWWGRGKQPSGRHWGKGSAGWIAVPQFSPVGTLMQGTVGPIGPGRPTWAWSRRHSYILKAPELLSLLPAALQGLKVGQQERALLTPCVASLSLCGETRK